MISGLVGIPLGRCLEELVESANVAKAASFAWRTATTPRAGFVSSMAWLTASVSDTTMAPSHTAKAEARMGLGLGSPSPVASAII